MLHSHTRTDPTALDYLKAAIDMVDPFNYLKGSLDGIAGGLGEVVGLLGDQAAGFLNSIKSLGGSAVDGLQDGFTVCMGHWVPFFMQYLSNATIYWQTETLELLSKCYKDRPWETDKMWIFI